MDNQNVELKKEVPEALLHPLPPIHQWCHHHPRFHLQNETKLIQKGKLN